MNINEKRSPLLRSNTISNKKIEEIINQLNRVPNFWKKRLVQDNWQIILTDKMPQEFGGILGKFYVDGNEKQMWLNVGTIDIYSNIIYIAFAYYIVMEYCPIGDDSVFDEIIKRNEREITLFLGFRGKISTKKDTIFAELFSFVIETNGNVSIAKIDEPYQYVKKWVYGQIFERNISYIPSYIEIGTGVIDEQIDIINNAFKKLPQRLQNQFLKENWKIRISNEILIKNYTYGLCSTMDRKIFVRSSTPDLSKTLWHECGHYLDIKEFFASNRSFKRIYNKEKNLIKILYESNEEFEYAISDNHEYFAEIFALFMKDPNMLKKNAFDSYRFMQNTISRWT